MAQGMMRLVVTGMFRSGSTRTFNLFREAGLRRHGGAFRHGHCDSAEALDTALRDPSPCIFKEHLLSEEILAHCSGTLFICTVREPMPALVSYCSALGHEPEHALELMDEAVTWIERLGPSAILVPWEEATTDSATAIRRLLRKGGVRAGYRESAQLARRWSRERAERLSRGAEAMADRRPWDPVALFHPGHVGPERTVEPEVIERLETGINQRQLEGRIDRILTRARSLSSP